MPSRSVSRAVRLVAGLAALLGAGCMLLGNPDAPIPTEFEPAPGGKGRVLVVVLPGIANDDDNLRKHGVHETIQRAWPHADVVLTGATYPYYHEDRLVPRLRDDVLRDARKRGYREVWLAGGSLGGFGALLYERHHPGEVTGLVILSPWLGLPAIVDEVRAAGGARHWQPGDVPEDGDFLVAQRQVWELIHGWAQRPSRARRVWLICGQQDALLEACRLMAAALPKSNVIERPGGHDWDFWIPAAEQIFAHVARTRGTPAS